MMMEALEWFWMGRDRGEGDEERDDAVASERAVVSSQPSRQEANPVDSVEFDLR